jgi:hypothetical protein
LQDVLTLHGRQFKDAQLIVASSPCQEYSYRAMPWSRAKALPPPDNSLFDACFRIQREACEAAGRHIPMVVENVCGAQRWVGRARWHYGSYYLWGDVPALMPMVKKHVKVGGLNWKDYGKPGYKACAFNDTAVKNTGGSWFRVSHNNVPHSRGDAIKHTPHMTNPDEHRGVKFAASGAAWFDGKVPGYTDKMLGGLGPAAFGSKSTKRKMASARIAMIPEPLARHIARVYAT